MLVIVALVVGGISFYGGTVYAKGKTAPQGTSVSGRLGGANGGGMGVTGARGFGGQGRTAGGFVNGQVVSKDATSITVQTGGQPGGSTDGSGTGSKIVFFSASTTVFKMSAGSMDDVAQGTDVIVTGKTNTDGSVTAQSIQIRPAGMMGGIRPQGAPSGQPTNGGSQP